MLTYTYVSKGKFELMEKPKPVLMYERDAIVKVTLASICSSDLHIKHGSVPRAVPGITVAGGKEAKTQWILRLSAIKNKLSKESYSVPVDEYSYVKSVYDWIMEMLTL